MITITLTSEQLEALARVTSTLNPEQAGRLMTSSSQLAAFTEAQHIIDRAATEQVHASRSDRLGSFDDLLKRHGAVPS